MEGELEPLLWSSKIELKMGKPIQKALQLAIPKLLLHDQDFKKLFAFVAVAELEVIKQNDFSCCVKESCFKKATACVSTPWFYEKIQDRPSMIVNIICIPVCGKSACENELRRKTDLIMKSANKEFRKNNLAGFGKRKRRICNACKKMSNRKGEFKKCSGCNATFYCSEKCQLETVFEISFRDEMFYDEIFYNLIILHQFLTPSIAYVFVNLYFYRLS